MPICPILLGSRVCQFALGMGILGPQKEVGCANLPYRTIHQNKKERIRTPSGGFLSLTGRESPVCKSLTLPCEGKSEPGAG